MELLRSMKTIFDVKIDVIKRLRKATFSLLAIKASIKAN